MKTGDETGRTTPSSWDRIRDGVNETEYLIGQKKYNEAMIEARKTLEYMVIRLCEKNELSETNLIDQIEALATQGIISKTTCEHYHKIRTIGNKALHEGDNSAFNANQAHHLLSQEVYAFANDYDPRRRTARTSQPSGDFTAKEARSRQLAEAAAREGKAEKTEKGDTEEKTGKTPEENPASKDPVPAGRTSGSSSGSSSSRSSEKGGIDIIRDGREGRRDSRDGRDGRDGRRDGTRTSASSANRRRPRRTGIDPASLIKPLLLLAIIIVLIIIIRMIRPPKEEAPAETTAPVETTLEEETTAAVEPVAETEAPETVSEVYKTTTTVRVRSTPDTSGNGNIVATLGPDTRVEFIGAYDEKWAKIRYNGEEAYISAQYVTKAD